MKIKVNKQVNLPQLIEYAWDNDIKNEIFIADKQLINIEFDDTGDVLIYGNGSIKTAKFSIEVEEEVTEDTEFDIIVLIEKDSCSATWANNSINKLKDNRSKEFHAYIDGEFKCIWRDGKLVE